MKIGIIAAMKEELELLKTALTECTKVSFGSFEYYTGKLDGYETALMLCGIGKVNAAVGTTLLIDKLKPTVVINTGVAGGFSRKLNIGDIVVSREVRHHDADATAFNYEMGQIPQMPASFKADERLIWLAEEAIPEDMQEKLHTGAVFSGDSFIHTEEQIQSIAQRFPFATAVEMEGAAIAQTCYLFNVPFVIIRSISDKVWEPESSQDYEKFMKKAAGKSVKIVHCMLKRIQEVFT
ncbi:MAG: 5'-methylthioadenosine/adenosylhomocysteine nucleosidase [Spirochaetia bacterium]